jgi:dienelactone hydrolase
MKVISETEAAGVIERRFDVQVSDQTVPGILWAPVGATGSRPLLLLGHGGSLHKRFEGLVRFAHRMVRNHGYAAVAIDAPGHGERIDEAQHARMREQFKDGFPLSAEQLTQWLLATIPGAVAEWKATLDAVQALDYVGQGKVGYFGLSMGATLGIPFVAAEPRVTAAIFGLAGLGTDERAFGAAARSLTLPILFIFQLHDEVVPAELGLGLFRAFGSSTKTMHINPGKHIAIPPFEVDEYELFLVRHLSR